MTHDSTHLKARRPCLVLTLFPKDSIIQAPRQGEGEREEGRRRNKIKKKKREGREGKEGKGEKKGMNNKKKNKKEETGCNE